MTQQFLPHGLRPESTHEETRAAAEHYYRAAVTTDADVENILAPALGFPAYEPGSPGYCPDRVNYVTGDHVAQSLADMAAGRLVAARAVLEHYHAESCAADALGEAECTCWKGALRLALDGTAPAPQIRS